MALTALAALAGSVVLVGCTGAVTVEPAPGAADPACAEVLRAVPDQLAGLPRRETTAQAALAWGEPAVVLRCGVDPPGPTTDTCLSVETPDGAVVDWIAVPGADGGGGSARFTTYGREPALELLVPAALTDGDPALPQVLLDDVGPAAAGAQQTRSCLGPEDA